MRLFLLVAFVCAAVALGIAAAVFGPTVFSMGTLGWVAAALTAYLLDLLLGAFNIWQPTKAPPA
jgi:hypothetical protein